MGIQIKKYFSLTLLFLLMISYVFGNDSLAAKHKNYRILRYYTYGLRAYGGCDEKCERAVSKKYGFIDKEKAGCVVSSQQKKRWDRHNKKVNEKLKVRNGENWRDKYYEEINQCCKK